MSRIGKLPIPIPSGVTVTIQDGTIRVKGPKGELERKIVGNLEVKIEDNTLYFKPLDEERQTNAYFGLMRALTYNMVVGVTECFTKKLKITGVGYRGEMKGNTLVLNVGYSKPVEFPLPQSVKGTVSKEGIIELSSIDKELLGNTAAHVRKVRKPDAYQGKGIRYIDEVVRLKPGKSAAKG